MWPLMMLNLLQPARAAESLGAAFVAVIDASLLDLHPVVAETSAQEMRLSDVILGGYE
jgi:hypothetical protein